jgi:hypothetical protein
MLVELAPIAASPYKVLRLVQQRLRHVVATGCTFTTVHRSNKQINLLLLLTSTGLYVHCALGYK